MLKVLEFRANFGTCLGIHTMPDLTLGLVLLQGVCNVRKYIGIKAYEFEVFRPMNPILLHWWRSHY